MDQVRDLKKKGGSVLVAGSRTLVGTLIENDLVDEYRLMVYPMVLGSGKRLFDKSTGTALELVEAKPVGGGIVTLTYARAGR